VPGGRELLLGPGDAVAEVLEDDELYRVIFEVYPAPLDLWFRTDCKKM